MNMQALMRQAQNLQKDMLKTKEEIDKMEFTSTSSFVTVTVNGKKEITNIKIAVDNEFDTSDMELLEEMIQVAVNDALKQVDKVTEKKMGKYSSMIPGLF